MSFIYLFILFQIQHFYAFVFLIITDTNVIAIKA